MYYMVFISVLYSLLHLLQSLIISFNNCMWSVHNTICRILIAIEACDHFQLLHSYILKSQTPRLFSPVNFVI